MFRLLTFLLLVGLCSLSSFAQIAKILDPQMDPLPQEPAISKAASDLADEGLKGKVKLVVQERSEILRSEVQPRQMSNVALFNEKGNLVQRDYYDYRGNPYQITVYGYIDGKRVSKSRYISYDYDPPPVAAPPGAIKDLSKRDARYQYSYEYSYTDGQLVGTRLLSNNGKVLMWYVYNPMKSEVEELVFTDGNILNQRYLRRLDNKGNIVEEIFFGLSNRDIYGDHIYRYIYEFDKRGNWIKKEASVEVIENRIASFKPAFTHYRTISYF